MIPFIPPLYRYLGAALIVGLLLGGIYLKGKSDGKEVVQAVLDEQRATWQEQFDRQSAETAAKEAAWAAKTKEIEDELQTNLADATARADDLAGRLRQHTRRRCGPLPPAPGSTTDPDAASGVTDDGDRVDAALAAHLGACGRDAERLTAFQAFYQSIRENP